MNNRLSETQEQLLQQMLFQKSGLSVNVLAEKLKISGNAVRQHFVLLEGGGYIQKKHNNPTAGRPAGVYELTTLGLNYFPKQYAWFCGLILEELRDEMGEEALVAYMRKLGRKLSGRFKDQFAGLPTAQRVEELTALLSALGFQAELSDLETDDSIGVDAFNCVFHDLAAEYPAICEFDLSLMGSLLERPLEHASCMAKGDCQCRFIIKSE